MNPPVEVAHLFPHLDKKLDALLKSLTEEEWELPTVARQWKVKDVASHLLDGNLRTISSHQGYEGSKPPPVHDYRKLVTYLNQLNASWVEAMKRVSPQLLIWMLNETGKQYCKIMAETPLFEQAKYGIAWAGEAISFNWFHMAREYTEKMHHQLQIRQAVNQEAELMTRDFFYPFIDTLMYGLPHTLRHTTAKENAAIAVTVTGDGGGDWFVIRKDRSWLLSKQKPANVEAMVWLDPSVSWKLFTRGISPGKAAHGIQLEGNKRLAEAVLNMVAVMA